MCSVKESLYSTSVIEAAHRSLKNESSWITIENISIYKNEFVCISGESGTGKDLIATTIHQHSTRAKKFFYFFHTTLCICIYQKILNAIRSVLTGGGYVASNTNNTTTVNARL